MNKLHFKLIYFSGFPGVHLLGCDLEIGRLFHDGGECISFNINLWDGCIHIGWYL